MRQREREGLQAMLDADPALQAAWDHFEEVLDRVTTATLASERRTAADMRHDFHALHEAALRIEVEAGENASRH